MERSSTESLGQGQASYRVAGLTALSKRKIAAQGVSAIAVTDPWFYNEYADGRKMGQYKGFEAAQDVAELAVHLARR